MINIKKIEIDKIDETIKFVMNYRKKLFWMFDNTQLPKDLKNFEEYYINSDYGIWFNCYDENKLIGTIGCYKFDFRFNEINVNNNLKTSEVVKLFIDPEYRRQGLATELYKHLKQEAKELGIEQFYLHTHDWLTGAENFWSKNGFEIIYKKIDGNMDIIHMIQKL